MSLSQREVQPHQIPAEKQVKDSAQTEKWSEGQRVSATDTFDEHRRKTNYRSAQGRKKQRQGDCRPAKKCADHREEFYVSATHPFDTGETLIRPRKRQEKSSAGQYAN